MHQPLASNYDALAACDDGSCIVYGCMVDLACNYEPTANVEDESCEFGTCPGCNDPDPQVPIICEYCVSFTYAGSTYTTENEEVNVGWLRIRYLSRQPRIVVRKEPFWDGFLQRKRCLQS